MSNLTPDPELKALETVLKALAPSPGVFDRDALFYQVGRAAATSPPSRFWPGVAAVMAVALVAVSSAWVLRPAATPVERIVTIVAPAPVEIAPAVRPSPTPPGASPVIGEGLARADVDYLRARDQVLRWGIESLPPARRLSSTPAAGLQESLWMLPPMLADQ